MVDDKLVEIALTKFCGVGTLWNSRVYRKFHFTVAVINQADTVIMLFSDPQ